MIGRWFFLVAGVFLAAWGRDQVDLWVDQTTLPELTFATSVEVRAGEDLLRAYPVEDGRWRMAISLDHVDPNYLSALVRYEDKRFWTHAGIDPRAMIRAAWDSARAGRVVSGGSTLTMQVARLLENSGTGRWQGKLRQMRVALALERRLTKDQILDQYLHRAPFGGNIEGIAAASHLYFGKAPQRLTAAEIGLLIALPQAPEARRPDHDPDAAENAASHVVRVLQSHGVFPAEAAVVFRQGLTRHAPPQLAPHLADRARAAAPDVSRHDLTIDPDLQRALQRRAGGWSHQLGDDLSFAIVVADHQTGAVRAHLGSPEYAATKSGFLDVSQRLRSPGSTLKPLVYAMAFDQGLAHPETLLPDRPHSFSGYAPQNFDGQFRGEVPARDALHQSLNLPVVHLTEAIGPARIMAAMRGAGMTPIAEGTPGLAISLGGLGLTLEDLVRLYGTLARGGRVMPLHWIKKPQTATDQTLLSRAAAWQVGEVLSNISPPRGYGGAEVAYKTGTSYGHRDAWAIGFDGAHVVGVWIGRPDGTAVPGAFGGTLAAPLLFEVFGHLPDAPLPPPPPETLIVAHAKLPAPLRRFGPQATTQPLDMIFPPNGAQLAVDGTVPAKVRAGRGPFTWLADGVPVARTRDRTALLDLSGPGFTTLAVIDADGASARVQVQLVSP